MHVYSAIICCSNSKEANILWCKNDWSMIHIQFEIDIKTCVHIFRFLIQQVKVDVEQIIRRRYADVASKFLNNQKSYFSILESIKRNIIVLFFSFRTLYCNMNKVDCVVIILRFMSFSSSFCCSKNDFWTWTWVASARFSFSAWKLTQIWFSNSIDFSTRRTHC